MNRTWFEPGCPVCKQLPKEDENGRLTCACGTEFEGRLSIRGTPEEEASLERAGFKIAQDIRGNVYYFLPEGSHLIELYSDGTWYSDKAASGSSMEEYFAWLREKRAAIDSAANHTI